MADKKKEEGGTGASMIYGATETIDPNNSLTPYENGSIEEAADLLNQEMYDLEFEDKTARINLCLKKIGLHECTEVLGGEIYLQECADEKSMEKTTIITNQHVE